jgi:hypothetical protein
MSRGRKVSDDLTRGRTSGTFMCSQMVAYLLVTCFLLLLLLLLPASEAKSVERQESGANVTFAKLWPTTTRAPKLNAAD